MGENKGREDTIKANELPTSPIVLFDGVCNLCNTSVDFLIRNDKRGELRFSALQSEVAESLLKNVTKPDRLPDSVMLLENGKLYTRSTAALKIVRHLPGYFKVFYVFIIIPRPVRDLVYDWIARNRYRWYGKKETCRLPSAAERARFL